MLGSLALLLVSPASAATWTVCPDGACDHETLGEAIATAADGDEILVGDGFYDESLLLDDRTLTFTAAEAAMPVVRGDGATGPLTVRGGTVRIVGLTLFATVGRALTVDGGADVTISAGNLRSDEAQLDGGVVLVDGATVAIETSFLADGLAVRSGGLLSATDADVTITESLLDGGGARQGGGVAVFGDSTVEVVATRISNGLSEYGGAVYVAGGEVDLLDSELAENWAIQAGGAVAVAGGRLTVTNAYVHANETSGQGAGVYVADGASARVELSRLHDNAAGASGGAVAVASGATVDLVRTEVHRNEAGWQGGGVSSAGSVASYQNSYCMNLSRQGGAVSTGAVEESGLPADLFSTNDVFNENVADYGGGIDHGWSTADVRQATFVGNQANDQGAAVRSWAGDVSLTRSIVAYHPAPAHGSREPSLVGATFGEIVFWSEANGVPEGAGEPADPMIRFVPGGDCNDYTWPAKVGAAARLGPPGDGDPIDYDGTLADLGATGGINADPTPWFMDNDEDGHPRVYDCDDTDPTVFPGAAEGWYDGTDGDCDGASDHDQDRDGYDDLHHGGDDCDDVDAAIHPGAAEIAGNDVDEDCDTIRADDGDGDGFSAAAGDCDDDDPNVNPNENDRDPAVDRDCDGTTDVMHPLRPRSCSTSPTGAGSALWLLMLAAVASRSRKEPA